MKATVEHDHFDIEAKSSDELNRFIAMYRHYCEISDSASSALHGFSPRFNTPKETKIEIAPNIFAHVLTYPTEKDINGLQCCTHCMERAAMQLRDLANICDEIVELTKRQGVKIEKK